MRFIIISIVVNLQICWFYWIDPDCFSMVLKGDRSCLPAKYRKPELQNRATKKVTKCGVKQAFVANIVGGEDTIPGEWPWMAKLVYDKDIYCAGIEYQMLNSNI